MFRKVGYIIDRPCITRNQLEDSFVRRGYQVRVSDSPDLDMLIREPMDLLVMEASLGSYCTLALIPRLRAAHPSTHICVCTLFGSIRTAVSAIRAGATCFLLKPASADQILTAAQLREPAPSDPIEHPTYHRAVWEYLQQCHELAGSTAEAARRLGLQRRSLRRMLQKNPPNQ
jgi:two-component system, response regulator RegA